LLHSAPDTTRAAADDTRPDADIMSPASDPPGQRARLLLGSLVAHVAVLGVFMIVLEPPTQSQGVEDEVIVAIDLVALAELMPGTEDAGVPAAGQQVPVQESVPVQETPLVPETPVSEIPVQETQVQDTPAEEMSTAEETPPQAQPDETSAPDVAEIPAPRPRPAPQRRPEPPLEATSVPDSPPTAAAPAPAPGAAPTGPAAPSAATAPAAASAAEISYARLLLSRLQRAIIYPRGAQRRGLEGVVRVEVLIAASGELRQVRLDMSSGHAVLDQAALALVRRVAPFPPVPPGLIRNRPDFAFRAPIQYQLN